jgi:hydrogenase maturation protease
MTIDLVVIGIGQSLRGDDAAGLKAVKQWQEAHPDTASQPKLRVELAELPGVGLLSLMEGAQAAILVDAVHSSAPPGTIHLLSEADLEGFGAGSGSAHGWGVTETLALGRLLNPEHVPARIQLVGIEASELGLGQTLSPPVAAALSRAVEQIERAVRMA